MSKFLEAYMEGRRKVAGDGPEVDLGTGIGTRAPSPSIIWDKSVKGLGAKPLVAGSGHVEPVRYDKERTARIMSGRRESDSDSMSDYWKRQKVPVYERSDSTNSRPGLGRNVSGIHTPRSTLLNRAYGAGNVDRIITRADEVYGKTLKGTPDDPGIARNTDIPIAIQSIPEGTLGVHNYLGSSAVPAMSGELAEQFDLVGGGYNFRRPTILLSGKQLGEAADKITPGDINPGMGYMRNRSEASPEAVAFHEVGHINTESSGKTRLSDFKVEDARDTKIYRRLMGLGPQGPVAPKFRDLPAMEHATEDAARAWRDRARKSMDRSSPDYERQQALARDAIHHTLVPSEFKNFAGRINQELSRSERLGGGWDGNRAIDNAGDAEAVFDSFMMLPEDEFLKRYPMEHTEPLRPLRALKEMGQGGGVDRRFMKRWRDWWTKVAPTTADSGTGQRPRLQDFRGGQIPA